MKDRWYSNFKTFGFPPAPFTFWKIVTEGYEGSDLFAPCTPCLGCAICIVAPFLSLKIETTGEDYMVAGSLPVRSGINHAEEIAILSVKFLSAVITFEIGPIPREKLKLPFWPSHRSGWLWEWGGGGGGPGEVAHLSQVWGRTCWCKLLSRWLTF